MEEAQQKLDVLLSTSPFTEETVRRESLKNRLCERSLRSVCWKICFHYFPSLDTSTWITTLQRERQKYTQLASQYTNTTISGTTSASDSVGSLNEADLKSNNPLALNEDNPWHQYFSDSEIRKVIQQDVDRTFPDIDYYRDAQVRQKMTNILFVYCKLNPEVSYRQGMHELLAPILKVVDGDAIREQASGNAMDQQGKLLQSLLSAAYVEHDTFSLFSAIMKNGKSWFEFNDEVVGRSKKPIKKPTEFDDFVILNKPTPPAEAARLNPIVMKLHQIHHNLVRRIDPQLYTHLEKLRIEPQLYGIRWIRLLFGREFSMQHLLILWDGLFAEDSTLKLVDYIFIAMLLKIREEILQSDYSECLILLMRYPAATKPHLFIEQAIYLREHPTMEGGVQISRQNDALAGRPPKPITPSQNVSRHDRPRPMSDSAYPSEANRPVSPLLTAEGMVKNFAQDVMKNPQFREFNLTLAGVMGEVKKNVNYIGENILGNPNPPRIRQASSPSDFTSSNATSRTTNSIPSTQPLPKPVVKQRLSPQSPPSPVRNNTSTHRRDLASLIDQCVSIIEQQIFHVKEEQRTDEAKLAQALVGLKHARDVLKSDQVEFNPTIMSDHNLSPVTTPLSSSKKTQPAMSTFAQRSPLPNASDATSKNSTQPANVHTATVPTVTSSQSTPPSKSVNVTDILSDLSLDHEPKGTQRRALSPKADVARRPKGPSRIERRSPTTESGHDPLDAAGAEKRRVYRLRTPPSCYLVPDFITPEQEADLLHHVYAESQWVHLKHRRQLRKETTLHKLTNTFGRLSNWGGTPSKTGTMVTRPLPPFLVDLIPRMQALGLFLDAPPNHVLVNEYTMHGIMPHQDGPIYHPLVATVSLGAPTLLEFTRHGEREVDFVVVIPPRSLFVQKNECYREWLHGIGDGAWTDRLEEVRDKAVNPVHVPKDKETSVRVSLTYRRVQKSVSSKIFPLMSR
ncbi:hypothetical protein BZG36_02856 [Bifiguratus adelaidae]|uniref:Rab-GAP TBC domain-containing protein n=1 Tax=Bifiguratus adelaidae TaxID=1938954 RepID=A0A261Y0F1_9FUNG|nr:hypothetical protein BZG36_02856 [Bifiguratus adelaidae]